MAVQAWRAQVVQCPSRVCKPFFQRVLDEQNTILNGRPARSSHKNGKTERNNGTFKCILDKLKRDKAATTNEKLIDRAFLSNIIHGSVTMSSIQQTGVYSPSIIGIPTKVLSEDVLNAHVKITAA